MSWPWFLTYPHGAICLRSAVESWADSVPLGVDIAAIHAAQFSTTPAA